MDVFVCFPGTSFDEASVQMFAHFIIIVLLLLRILIYSRYKPLDM